MISFFIVFRFVRVNIIKNIIMGISVGAVFFQTDAIDGIFGVLFQGMLFIMLGAFPSFIHSAVVSHYLVLFLFLILASIKVQ